ncbi:MAG: YigZ family protein [Gemmatimonadetes bacterium]|nr:YigZ family protein [Gemmatimonadota bacterium]
MSRHRVPARVHRVEEVIQRSRFITTAARAPAPAAAHAFVQRIREEHPDATHHCWAFVAGPPGSTARIGMSDDGEPHGTAGKPMLTTLLHSGVGEIVVVCSRWFGGVKLGTGGLSRAYSGGAKRVLESLPTEERVDRVRVEVSVGYAEVAALRRLAADTEAWVEAETYGPDVCWTCAVPEPELERFRRGVTELSRGGGRVREI